MNCPIVFKKATLEDEGEYLRLSKLFYATDAVLSPLPEEFHKNIFKEICRSSAYLEAFLFSFAGEIAGYGLVCFTQKDIASYMFLKNQFVFFDFEQSALSVFIEYIAMMGFWIFASFYMVRGIGKISALSKRKEITHEEN